MTLVFRHEPKKQAYPARLSNALQIQATYRNEPGGYKIRILQNRQKVPIVSLPHFTDADSLTNLKVGIEQLREHAEYIANSLLVNEASRSQMCGILTTLQTIDHIEIISDF